MIKTALHKLKELYHQKKWMKPVSVIVGILIILVIAVSVSLHTLFGGLNQVQLDESDLGISEQATAGVEEEKINSIVNLALFGIDTTEGAAKIGDQYRSDCIMVFTIDPIENQLKMTSILRDSKVPIEGHDPQKINAAYKYGGAQLAVKTINQNFKTNIKDYVTVDFAEMAEIIDLVGGLTIEITDAEAKNMMENNIIEPVKAGKRLLDGKQAVAYARVRKVDSDYYRASRQQTVLNLLFEKIRSMPASDYPALIKSFLKCVETSLSYGEIMKYVRSMDLDSCKIVKNTIPDSKYEENLWGGIDSTGSWVWVYDLDKAADRLHKIIYGKSWTPEEKEKETTTKAGNGSPGGWQQPTTAYHGGTVPIETTTSPLPEETTIAPPEETTKPLPVEEETTGRDPVEEETTLEPEPVTEEAPIPEPTTLEPTTPEPTTPEPTTPEPTTPEPTTPEPTTPEPTTPEPVIDEPETPEPTTPEPSVQEPDPIEEPIDDGEQNLDSAVVKE